MVKKLTRKVLADLTESDTQSNSDLIIMAIDERESVSIYRKSVNRLGKGYCFISRDRSEKYLWIVSEGNDSIVSEFQGIKINTYQFPVAIKCKLQHRNAEAIREQLEFTRPTLIGLQNSFGLGDRLGIANPAHLRAILKTDLKPILAQQSIREMERTHRHPDDIIDAATWAVLQEGFKSGFGADADHLKSTADIDYTIKAGFTMFTIDPSDYLNDEADTIAIEALESQVKYLPWNELESDPETCIDFYADKAIKIDNSLTLYPSRKDTLRAIVKYGGVITHTKSMYRYLTKNYPTCPREVELSIDESDSVTEPFEHYLIVNELQRLDVELVSLAPKFTGRFEKGIDYIGNLNKFREEYIKHLKISQKLGPYKLSVHSGSDKFSIYKIIGSLKMGYVHIKTAGTSYLEALRTIARVNPDLFREILDYSRNIYESEKLTYHVSANVGRVPLGSECKDEELVELFADDQVDARQVMHVCFGRVLSDKNKSGSYLFRDRIIETLKKYEDVHYAVLQSHFARHFNPLTTA